MSILDLGHWRREDYVQRVTRKQWREVLLNRDDDVVINGRPRKLVGKDIGYGVVEVSFDDKVPLKEKSQWVLGI